MTAISRTALLPRVIGEGALYVDHSNSDTHAQHVVAISRLGASTNLICGCPTRVACNAYSVQTRCPRQRLAGVAKEASGFLQRVSQIMVFPDFATSVRLLMGDMERKRCLTDPPHAAPRRGRSTSKPTYSKNSSHLRCWLLPCASVALERMRGRKIVSL